MKVLLVAINAKYIHSNLAVYSLKRYAEERMHIDNIIDIAEYTINNCKDQIIKDLYRRKPDFLAFSCYIWNIELVKDIITEYKKLDNKVIIWLGGPEVSYNAKEVLTELNEVDGIVIGEGEETIYHVFSAYITSRKEKGNNACELNKIHGIAYIERELCQYIDNDNHQNKIIINNERKLCDLSLLPFPYDCISELNNNDINLLQFNSNDINISLLKNFENRIIYYESSRGCPFLCSYCLSSIDKTVRYKDINKVYEELSVFLKNKVHQVKFVDRTFNCNISHAMNIWNFILKNDNGITNFHFEIAADLLTDEEIKLISCMRPGLIQLEIGIQSANPLTIKAINRKTDINKAAEAIAKIKKSNNVHQHLDLIAGLPYEDYESFKMSFNTVYAMEPDQLQLGFLKVLKGSPIEGYTSEYGIVYQSKPPHEVLYTKWLSYDDILRLKAIEDMVEVYYNSCQYKYAMMYLKYWFSDAFSMYEELSEYYESHYLIEQKHARIKRYEILINFFDEILGVMSLENKNTRERIREAFLELIEYDLYLREKMKKRPEFLINKEKHKSIIKNLIDKEKKEHEFKDSIHIEYFSIDPILTVEQGDIIDKGQYILFDYGVRDALNYNAFTRII